MRQPYCLRACTLRVAPDGVWRSLVARPLWERKAVGSNPATPTTSRNPPRAARSGQALLFGARTACGYYASCAPVCLHSHVSQGPRIRWGPARSSASAAARSRNPRSQPQGDRTVKSAVETLNPTRVRLTVEVPFEELKDSLDAAYRKINQQVTVKGFRKGKVPARIIDQRFGRGAVLEEAVNDALPKFYTEAVNEAELTPLGQPEVDITELKDGETLNFTAEVDIRPTLEIPDFSGIEVTVDAIEVPDEDVDK